MLKILPTLALVLMVTTAVAQDRPRTIRGEAEITITGDSGFMLRFTRHPRARTTQTAPQEYRRERQEHYASPPRYYPSQAPLVIHPSQPCGQCSQLVDPYTGYPAYQDRR